MRLHVQRNQPPEEQNSSADSPLFASIPNRPRKNFERIGQRYCSFVEPIPDCRERSQTSQNKKSAERNAGYRSRSKVAFRWLFAATMCPTATQRSHQNWLTRVLVPGAR